MRIRRGKGTLAVVGLATILPDPRAARGMVLVRMAPMERILVTGAAGFIGANFVQQWLAEELPGVVSLDALTYAGNLANLDPVSGDPRHVFVRGDICDEAQVRKLFAEHRPSAVVHFAAESHVDRSIAGPADFIRTNVTGTFTLLQAALDYWRGLEGAYRKQFRFLHVSTDEVYGSLGPQEAPFTESHPYQPNSPYSASKAASDHLVRAWHHTYGLPVLTTNCSNNYGPYQFPEKLIPLMIVNALAGKTLPVYGDGGNVRDWLYVGDHCSAVRAVLARGRPGETYNIGGWNELGNLDVVQAVCDLLDAWQPLTGVASRRSLVAFVTDRPGHDRRYAIDARKIESELGWRPARDFHAGLTETVRWYLDNPKWLEDVVSGDYRNWYERNYGERDMVSR
jgi:dTDP-glucose 4,6-dehydratase